MGLYDRVNFTCPECGGIVEVQSKAGRCLLDEFVPSEVPTEIALDIVGTYETCDDCGRRWLVAFIEAPPPPTIPMRLR